MIRLPWPKRLKDLGRARCRTLRELNTSQVSIPAGAVGFVKAGGNGWNLLRFEGDGCSACGCAPRVSRCSREDFELIDEAST